MKWYFIIIFFVFSCTNFSQTWKEYYYSGLKKYDNRDYNGAIVDFTKSIELNPNFVYAYFNRGVVKEIMNDRNGACADYKIAAKMGHKGAEEIIWDDHCK
ncbi:MAG TPA: tetratricopeptide repeat protein [Cytophagales bacterium]|jgi:tetratricopeptide (TPR) repeat protein|nr:tetratricopeptide repeat protein [Cytophagales bacterium]